MAISIPGTGGTSTATTGTSYALSTSASVPVGALVGDVLFVVATSERGEIPTVTLGSGGTFTTIRSELSTNLSMVVAWRRLTSADLTSAVTMTNTAQRRQALGMVIVRGAGDPVSITQAFTLASNGVLSKTGPAPTPTADNSLSVGLWGIVPNNGTYTGYNFTSSYTERCEADAVYPSGLNPTSLIDATLWGTGTAGVAQAGDTVSNTIGKFDSMGTVATLAPSTNVPPTASAGPDQTVSVGTAVTLTGTASDSDGTVATVAWAAASGNPATVTLSGASTTTATFTAPSTPGDYTFTFTATDNSGASTTDTMVVHVNGSAPSVVATVAGGYAVIDATGTTGTGTLTYTISPSTGVTQPSPGLFLVPQGSTAATYTVTATDSASQTGNGTVTVPAAGGFVTSVRVGGAWT